MQNPTIKLQFRSPPEHAMLFITMSYLHGANTYFFVKITPNLQLHILRTQFTTSAASVELKAISTYGFSSLLAGEF
jgi:hypothetical protein